MQCYTELLPPTGVTHALAVPFISETAENLIVIRTSLLQVFTLLKFPPRQNEGQGTHSALPHPADTKLVLEKEYPLSGTVTGLSRVKPLHTKSGGDAILLALRNAKLSLIEWDPERHGISTVSIHYYEREDLNRSPWAPDLDHCSSILSVDPRSRCAVFNFGVRNLAILPFHQAGDDLVMDDYDSELDKEQLDESTRGETRVQKKDENPSYQTPYAASFVLPLTALDPSLLHPVSLSFLYEYREPTFGILYSQIAPSNALLHERKDVMLYTVFTLDLEQRASTTLLSVSKLPSDLFKVIALPPPVGGALLIGSNEIVHVDQAGKTNAIGVNEFYRQVSAFAMSDQSDLAFRLEGSVVERLGDGSDDLLLALASGEMALIKFNLDGRSVSGMSVHPLPRLAGGHYLKSAASCSACLGDGNIFVGSENADSVLLGWSHLNANPKKQRLGIRQGLGDNGDISESEELDDAYEDDLYSSAPDLTLESQRPSTHASALEHYQFRLNDHLSSIGPLRDLAFGKASSQITKSQRTPPNEDVSAGLELVASHGSDGAGSLVVIRREIDPLTAMCLKMDGADGVWSATMTPGNRRLSNNNSSIDVDSIRQYVIVSRPDGLDRETSEVLLLEGEEMKPLQAPEFNPNADQTIDIGPMVNGTRLVQVLRNEIRSYDKDLGLSQIYPIWDEDKEEERTAVAASFANPYLAILRDDSSLLLLQAEANGDLDEITLSDEITTSKWRFCSLYRDQCQSFNLLSSRLGAGDATSLMFLVNQEYKLFVFSIPGLSLLSVVDGLDCLQPILSAEPPRRSNTREPLMEAIVADLGDQWSVSPYLIIRTGNDDLVVYKPIYSPAKPGNGESCSLKFVRETNHTLCKSGSRSSSTLNEKQKRARPLRVLPNISGLSTVFIPGDTAGFVLRTTKSSPHRIRLRGESTLWLSGISSTAMGCENGFIYVDSEHCVRMSQLPLQTEFDYPWTLHRIPLDEQVDCLTYSTSSETYVLGTSTSVDFKLPDNDELHPEWRNEAISFFPKVPQSSIKVISPVSWTIVDSYLLDPAEHVTAVKNVNMEISENTHERKDLIVVGTAIAKGEDIPARGCIYVFDVVEVVPEPDKPETGRRLKLIGKESVKGAVTALSGIGGQGFVVVSQGQKCMVRGLKEDGSLLPVAFMDMQCFVSVVKELKGTGLCILGDAVKGLWFAGYSEEPYKMTLFGKDPDYLEVVAADFLPDGSRLYILVADSDCNLHVLQYDPEDPKSSNGDRLLNRSKFHTGNFASVVTLLPRTAVSSELLEPTADQMDVEESIATHHVLIASQNGSLALVTTVAEDSYRRLSALQSQLTNTVEHAGGLNPRAFRAVESDGTGGRGMVDGNLLRQWLNLSKQRQTEIAGRIGATDWEIRADLEAVGGDGLGYL